MKLFGRPWRCWSPFHKVVLIWIGPAFDHVYCSCGKEWLE